MFTDANAWIGEEPTVIEVNENERSVFTRKSVKKEVNTQGKWFVSCMNSINMIILNGLKSEAQNTLIIQEEKLRAS